MTPKDKTDPIRAAKEKVAKKKVEQVRDAEINLSWSNRGCISVVAGNPSRSKVSASIK